MMFWLLSFLAISAVNSFPVTGVTIPMGYFDPIGFSAGKSPSQKSWIREAELKHGRWGMVATTAIPSYELVSHDTGIHSLDHVSPLVAGLFVSGVAAGEFQTMLTGWKSPFQTSGIFQLKDGYIPGDLGFNLRPDVGPKSREFMENAELNHGRLAMIGSLGMLAQELVTDKPLF